MCSVNSKIEVPVTPEDMCQAFGHDSSMCGLPLLQSQSPGGIRAGRIFAIADDRTFGIGQMHPDLICADPVSGVSSINARVAIRFISR